MRITMVDAKYEVSYVWDWVDSSYSKLFEN